MEITKIANLTEEEINVLKATGILGKTINEAFADGSITKLDASAIDLIKAVIDVLTRVVNK